MSTVYSLLTSVAKGTWELGGQNLLLDRNDPNCARISANLWFSYNPLSWCQTADDATTGQEIKGQRLAVPFWSFLSESFHFVANCASHGQSIHFCLILATKPLLVYYFCADQRRPRTSLLTYFLLVGEQIMRRNRGNTNAMLSSNSFPIKNISYI